MAIRDLTGTSGSVTAGWHALQFFTDREAVIRHFAESLHAPSPPERISFFHGAGGNGKSLMIRALREHYCKRLPAADWEYCRTREDVEFAVHLSQAANAKTVPSVELDFGAPVTHFTPREPFSALLAIRRQLALHGLNLPLFDFACIWHLHQTGQLTPDRVKSLFPRESMDVVSAIADAVATSGWASVAKAVLTVFDKHAAQRLQLYFRKRRIAAEDLKQIQRMDPVRELIEWLPLLCATDLNTALGGSGIERLVLFFDTHEMLHAGSSNEGEAARQKRDEWLRAFLSSLELTSGIVVVVAGREVPRWSTAARYPIPTEYLDVQTIGDLTFADADAYLQGVGVAEPDVRRRLLSYAETATKLFHPLYLGLCADVFLTIHARKGNVSTDDLLPSSNLEQNSAILLDCLLQNVDRELDAAVRALSACRSFSAETYYFLGEILKFHTSASLFSDLTRMSFVRSAGTEDGHFAMHELLRRLFDDRRERLTLEAHRELARRDIDRTDDPASVASAIFHANRVNWQQSLELWTDVVSAAVNSFDLPRARTLLSIMPELWIGSWYAMAKTAMVAGQFIDIYGEDQAVEMLREAHEAFGYAREEAPEDAVVWRDSATLQFELGDALRGRAQYEAAAEMFEEGVRHIDRALGLGLERTDALNVRGLLLRGLGDIAQSQARHRAASDLFSQAVQAFNESIAIKTSPAAFSNRAACLVHLAEIARAAARMPEAADLYRAAIRDLEESTKNEPGPQDLNRGAAYRGLAKVLATSGHQADAVSALDDAVAIYDELLDTTPAFIEAWNAKGLTHTERAKLHARAAEYAAAEQMYIAAIDAYDHALELAPRHIGAAHNKASSFRDLAEMQAARMRYAEAEELCERAIGALETARERTPAHPVILNSIGFSWSELAAARLRRDNAPGAREALHRAIETFDLILKGAPDNHYALNNKGIALKTLGEVEATPKEAIDALNRAIDTFDTLLGFAPDAYGALNNKGLALLELGGKHLARGSSVEAGTAYDRALETFDAAARSAPGQHAVIYNRITVRFRIGELAESEQRVSDARAQFELALQEIEVLLNAAPDDVNTRNVRGGILIRIAQNVRVTDPEVGAVVARRAIADFHTILASAPRSLEVRNNMAVALKALAACETARGDHSAAVQALLDLAEETGAGLRDFPGATVLYGHQLQALVDAADLLKTTDDRVLESRVLADLFDALAVALIHGVSAEVSGVTTALTRLTELAYERGNECVEELRRALAALARLQRNRPLVEDVVVATAEIVVAAADETAERFADARAAYLHAADRLRAIATSNRQALNNAAWALAGAARCEIALRGMSAETLLREALALADAACAHDPQDANAVDTRNDILTLMKQLA